MNDFSDTDLDAGGEATTYDDVPVQDEGTILYETPEGDYFEAVDTDGDGIADTLVGYLGTVGSIVVMDQGLDGAEAVAIDGNGDGAADLTIVPQGDGMFYVEIDADYDGVFETNGTVSADDIASYSPELWAAIDGTLDDGVADPTTDETPDPTDETTPDPSTDEATPDPTAQDPTTDEPTEQYPEVVDGQVVGDPFGYSEVWFEQSWNGSCVPASVAQIYNLYTGENVSDLDFVELTNQIESQGSGGWIVGPDGSPGLPPETAADLLEAAGIPATVSYGSLDTLSTALDGGYGVMVAIDSGEVWYGEETEDDAMDHMVVVSAIDYETNTVYLSDTGSPDGQMEAVPLDVFMDAWADSDYLMVECDQSVDQYQSGQETTEDDTTAEPVGAAGAQAVGGTADDGVRPFSAALPTVVQGPWLMLPVTLHR